MVAGHSAFVEGPRGKRRIPILVTDTLQTNSAIEELKRGCKHEKEAVGLNIYRDASRQEIMYAPAGLEKEISLTQIVTELRSKDKMKKTQGAQVAGR